MLLDSNSDAALRAGRRPLLCHDLIGVAWRRHVAAVARAEVEHAADDWARLVARLGLGGLFDAHAPFQPHPSEPYRLAHEAWAATLLNIEGHLAGANALLGQTVNVLKAQRLAGAASAQWAERALATQADLVANLMPRRRAIWRAFLEAAQRYRAARALIDRAGRRAA